VPKFWAVDVIKSQLHLLAPAPGQAHESNTLILIYHESIIPIKYPVVSRLVYQNAEVGNFT
jgi:hypothetical protein